MRWQLTLMWRAAEPGPAWLPSAPESPASGPMPRWSPPAPRAAIPADPPARRRPMGTALRARRLSGRSLKSPPPGRRRRWPATALVR